MYKNIIEKILGRTCFAPEEGLDIGDDLDILDDDTKDDDNKDDDKEDKEDKDDDKVDDDEDNKDDDEEKDKDDEDEDKDDDKKDDEDETEEDQLPSVKDIKKDFPDFFKKHPEVKAAIFRDQKFSEIIGTPEEAENAVNRSNLLAQVEDDLFKNSNPSRLLVAMKKDNEGAYEKTLYNIFSHLQEHDRPTYIKLGALPIKQLLRNAYREGEGDKSNLGKAAIWIHRFMFGNDAKFDDNVEAESVKKEDKSQAQKDYEDRLSKLEQKEYDGFKGAVDQSYVTKMDRFLRETLDKDERLTEWTRKNIINETLTQIVDQLKNDTRHQTALNSLWRNAKTAGFNNDFKSRIINTALARAKSLAPSIRAKLVNEALGKSSKKKDEKRDKKDDSSNRQPKTEHRFDRRDTKSRDTKKPLTDMDILRS